MASPVAGTKSRPPTTLNPDAPTYEVLTSNSSSTLYVGADETTLLQTARAVLYNPNRPDSIVRVRAILDTGSQRSYVTDGVKQALSLETEEVQQLSIATFGAAGHKSQRFEVLRVGLKMKDGKNQELKLIKVPSICEPLTAQPISLCLNKHDHLNRLDLADYSDGQETLQIDVLIGADYYWELVTGKTSRGKDGPVAVHTRLGWVLSGPAPKTKQSKNSVNLLTTHTLHIGTTGIDADTLNRTLQSFWELESLGVKQPDQCVFTEFKEKIQFKSGRYEVSLPWRDVHQPLPDNYQLALKRLRGLQHRLQQQPTLLKDPEPPDGHAVHYLPHHAVVRQDKAMTKLRIVYDASAKTTGPSLNDCLYTGPKFDQRIMDILLRFRTSKIALTADIERAFLQVCVEERDQDVLRFLWFNDVTKTQPQIQVLKFTRVVFGCRQALFC